MLGVHLDPAAAGFRTNLWIAYGKILKCPGVVFLQTSACFFLYVACSGPPTASLKQSFKGPRAMSSGVRGVLRPPSSLPTHADHAQHGGEKRRGVPAETRWSAGMALQDDWVLIGANTRAQACCCTNRMTHRDVMWAARPALHAHLHLQQARARKLGAFHLCPARVSSYVLDIETQLMADRTRVANAGRSQT